MFCVNNTELFDDKDSAADEAVRLAKLADNIVDISYLNYDSEARRPAIVSKALPCGCVKNEPDWNRLGDYDRKCEAHNVA